MEDDVVFIAECEVENDAEITPKTMTISSEDDDEITVETTEGDVSEPPEGTGTEGAWSPYKTYRLISGRWTSLIPYCHKNGSWKKVKASIFKKG